MPRTVRRLWEGRAAGFGELSRSFWYESFVPDPIAGLDLTLSGGAVEAMSAADRALGELEGGTGHPGLEALSRQLLRAESVASSWIEGLQISHRRLSRAIFDPSSADRTAKSVAGNVSAMDRAIQLGSRPGDVTVADVLELHRLLFEGTWDEAIAGRLRSDQNWIGGTSINPRHAEFIPPPETEVEPLLEDLCRFARRTDIPAIAQAAIVHAQFETIHPFPDGNGRVGRALIHVVLRRREAVRTFVPPVSIVLAANAGTYVAGLTMFREGGVGEWCRLFSTALRDSARLAVGLGAQLAEVQAAWRERAGRPRRTSATQRLIEQLAARPVLDINGAAELLGVSYPQARVAVLTLEQAGVLVPVTIGRRRNRAWECLELIELLDGFEFAATAPTRDGELRP
jgi:Fic family protein